MSKQQVVVMMMMMMMMIIGIINNIHDVNNSINNNKHCGVTMGQGEGNSQAAEKFMQLCFR